LYRLLAKSPLVSTYDLSSLKVITSAAAPLTKELIFAVNERLGIQVKQAYGLSEASPATHLQKRWDIAPGSVGPPLPFQTVLFMNTDLKEVPHGQEGEMWVKGPNVFKGYLNNEKATRESLTDDGFFKTGDIGYRDQDGNMYITDRVKELIKYKGFQVAPAELEGLLMGNDSVEDVAVVGIHDKERETEIPVACIVPAKGVERSKEVEEGIVKWIEERAAGHKRLRGGVRWVEQIPKSASGKILRKDLRTWLKDEAEKRKTKAKL
jgi:4-coumarate--CoA ligase